MGFGGSWRLEPCHHSTSAVRLEKGVFISVLNVEEEGGVLVLLLVVRVFCSGSSHSLPVGFFLSYFLHPLTLFLYLHSHWCRSS